MTNQQVARELAEHLANLPIIKLAKAGVDVALVNRFLEELKDG